VQRVWDCSSRLKQLEDRFDAQLTELSVRYRRAEQSMKRLDDKRQGGNTLPDGDAAASEQEPRLALRAFAYGSATPNG